MCLAFFLAAGLCRTLKLLCDQTNGTRSVLGCMPTQSAHCYTQVWKKRKTGPKRKYLTECIPRGRRLAGDGVSSVTDRSLQKKHRRQAASHSPWSQQDSGITLSTSMGMIGVLEITLIVPTLRVGIPLRTLRVRSRMWRRCVDKLQRYRRHALGSLNPQSVPFVTLCVTFEGQRSRQGPVCPR